MKALVAVCLFLFSLFAFAQSTQQNISQVTEVTEKVTVKLLKNDTIETKVKQESSGVLVTIGAALLYGCIGLMFGAFCMGLIGIPMGFLAGMGLSLLFTQGWIDKTVTYHELIVQDKEGKEYRIRQTENAPGSIGEDFVMLRYSDGSVSLRRP